MPTPQQPPAQFDPVAPEYGQQLNQGLAFSGEGQEYYCLGRVRFLAGLLAEKGWRPARVLDYGCGVGAAAPQLLGELGAAEVLGVDPSGESLAIARRNCPDPRARFALLADYQPRGDMDLVFTNGVFHHIDPAGRPAALALIRASLRPGGLLAFWENNPFNPGTRLLMRRLPFDRDAMPIFPSAARAMLAGAGFDILRTDYQFFFVRGLGWLRPLEGRLSKTPLGAQYQVLARRPA